MDSLSGRMRVGLVTFSDYASLIAPLTVNKAAVDEAVDALRVHGVTAMGDGLAVALDQIRLEREGGRDVPATIPVLTDGETNRGAAPAEVALAAAEAQVPVYSIGVEAEDQGWQTGSRTPR